MVQTTPTQIHPEPSSHPLLQILDKSISIGEITEKQVKLCPKGLPASTEIEHKFSGLHISSDMATSK